MAAAGLDGTAAGFVRVRSQYRFRNRGTEHRSKPARCELDERCCKATMRPNPRFVANYVSNNPHMPSKVMGRV
jgi:hypothetical protein